MPYLLRTLTVLSSTTIRLFAYVFFRWIPGHPFPPIILTSLVIYLGSVWLISPGLESQKTYANGGVSAIHDGKSQPNGGEAVAANGNQVSKQGKPNRKVQKDVNDYRNFDIGSLPSSDRDPEILNTLLTGLPSPTSTLWTLVTVGINILLAICTLDVVFRGILLYPGNDLTFTRAGFVSSNTAKLLIREPDPAQLPLFVYYRRTHPFSSSWSIVDKIYHLSNETDYTYPVTITDLRPSTQYHYSLSNNVSGSFTTAPPPASPSSQSLSFLTSSCIKPNFPYAPFRHPIHIPGLETLSTILQSIPKPSFMLFLGDFIYIDVPLRLGSTRQHYRSEYRRVYSSPSWDSSPQLRSLPWLHTLDDHEIANDWSSGNTTAPYPAAADPFHIYHTSVNPPIPAGSAGLSLENTTFFTFTQGPASFFLLDTRTYRTPPSLPNSTILGPQQLPSLLSYLHQPEPKDVKWKIIASSVPFTKNWQVGTSDTWGGFLTERQRVLEAMWHAEASLGVRFVILSGDRHEFGVTRFPPNSTNTDSSTPGQPGSNSAGPHEFSVGPLSMFYLPFRTYKQTSPSDIAIKYIPDGNSKVGLIDITNLEHGEQSLFKYSLFVDGKRVWEYVLMSPDPTAAAVAKPPLW